MDLIAFLKAVITSEKGWFCLAYATIHDDEEATRKTWKEEFFSWPDEITSIISRIRELGVEKEIYFSPYLFTEAQSLKAYAIVGKTIVADLDEANVLTLPLEPTILVETSPGRHQGYWILRTEVDNEEHETISKRLTYSIPRCDKTGWFLGKKVRVPETYNHKYTIGPQYIRVVQVNNKIYTTSQLEEIVGPRELFGTATIEIDEENLEWATTALIQDIGPQEMLVSVRQSIPTLYPKYNILSQDRSTALWALMMGLFRAGLQKEKVLYLAYHCVNNKFKDLRLGGLRELAKDVLRAQLATKIQVPDIKAKIRDARRIGDNVTERSEYIARSVREYMEKVGIFVHCSDDTVWFVRSDTGRPVQITARSDQLFNLLDNMFGINGSEKEASYVIHNLAAYIGEMPVNGKIATLSNYDHDMRIFAMHTGRKDVLVVTQDSIERVTNGHAGTIFPWSMSVNAISPHYRSLDVPWDDELFGDCLDNVMNIKKENAKALLKIWFLSVLLRDGLTSRPILALFGAPGSGKSTLFRRIYALMYGKDKGLNTVTREEDFDYAMAQDPLVVLDNVDTIARWLPDRLAATIAPTEIVRRKLFTDTDVVVLRRQAMIGLTAHDPKFSRPDVTDRLLLLTFDRLSVFKSETQILARIGRLRNALWGAILQDIQKIMRTEIPHSGYPQFRVEDFAIYGHWIATALGISQEFREAISSICYEQRNFNLEEDSILVDAIERLLQGSKIEGMQAGALWFKLQQVSRDQKGFNRKYTNAVSLGRRLWTIIDALREIFDVEWSVKKNIRIWTITNKVEVGTNGSIEIKENSSVH